MAAAFGCTVNGIAETSISFKNSVIASSIVDQSQLDQFGA
jgi:hypothetical protein